VQAGVRGQAGAADVTGIPVDFGRYEHHVALRADRFLRGAGFVDLHEAAFLDLKECGLYL
jgi:hypothetical protein